MFTICLFAFPTIQLAISSHFQSPHMKLSRNVRSTRSTSPCRTGGPFSFTRSSAYSGTNMTKPLNRDMLQNPIVDSTDSTDSTPLAILKGNITMAPMGFSTTHHGPLWHLIFVCKPISFLFSGTLFKYAFDSIAVKQTPL